MGVEDLGRRATEWRRYRIVDEDDIERALTATQNYVSQQAAERKQRRVVGMGEGRA